ncbi:MAG: RNA-binding transcriptional accessory protein, partial [Proteobacteria bacterium]|nr:RNA-binding transcriptional accessory protein [Pseudomonadota bacterium]
MDNDIKKIVSLIASDLNIEKNRIENTITLLKEGATYPFIARYRKEATRGLNEVDVENIDRLFNYHTELEERKLAIIKSVEEQGKLTDELKGEINSCSKKSELEDLYLPYKPKRRTKATIAKEAGLTGAADLMLRNGTIDNPHKALSKYINEEHNIKTVDDVIEWAGYIIIEKIKEDADIRRLIRAIGQRSGIIHSEKRKGATDTQEKYSIYYDYSEPAKSIPSHRYLAIARGETEKILSVKMIFPTDQIIPSIEKKYLRTNGFENEVARFIKIAEKQIELSVETEIRNEIFERSSDEAINVFRKNLETLLMKPPAGEVKILGIDPGIRTGSKFAMIDEYGNLLAYGTIYTEKGKTENKKAQHTIIETVKKYTPEYISIGNGTYSREMYDFITEIIRGNDLEAKPIITNESGASVYSGSPVAREEFPDLDITIRGAISIA